MTIELEVRCRQGERIVAPSRHDVVTGVWRHCAACRDGPESQGVRSHDDPTRTLSGPNNVPEVSSSRPYERSADR
jgi:hypothetical protein